MPDSLPLGWIRISLKELRAKKSISWNPNQYSDEWFELYSVPSHADLYPEILTVSEIGSNKQFVDTGDVLLSKINPRLNRAWIVGNFTNHKKIASTEWIVFPKNEKVEPRFLCYFLQTYSIRDYLSHNASGVGGSLTRVKPSIIDNLNINLPPLNEQKRIADKIDALFADIDQGIEAIKLAQRQLKTYRQSILKYAFEGKLTEQWREAHIDELEDVDTLLATIENEQSVAKNRKSNESQALIVKEIAELPDIPKQWKWVKPTAVEAAINNALAIGPFGSNLKVSDYTDNGVPLIFVRHIRTQNFADHNPKFISIEKAAELSSHKTTQGDILITKMGDPPGDACIYPRGSPDAIITADCIKWTVSQYVSNIYFAYFINSRIGQKQIQTITQGVAQQKISLAKFRNIMIPICSLTEQEEIVREIEARFAEIGQLEKTLQASLQQAESLRQSILKAAFAGRLVEQDPADEPAEKLLDVIRSKES